MGVTFSIKNRKKNFFLLFSTKSKAAMKTGENQDWNKESDDHEEKAELKSNDVNGKDQFIAYRALSGTVNGSRFGSRKVRIGNVKPDVPSRLSRVSSAQEE